MHSSLGQVRDQYLYRKSSENSIDVRETCVVVFHDLGCGRRVELTSTPEALVGKRCHLKM